MIQSLLLVDVNEKGHLHQKIHNGIQQNQLILNKYLSMPHRTSNTSRATVPEPNDSS